ncbi:MAG: phosphorylase [Methylobacter sp.]|uniref:phosphorylase family protein n=1 Tax=Methylobacter sp. TaxID=2051955 RepID=UPI00258DD527|nr:phosphorylase [Methylobacter sp.]MCL7419507.1 phosphorylase [Methylobacter sp.]
MITGIVVALEEELGTLTSKNIEKGHCVFISDKVLVAYSGAGPEYAQTAAELLVSRGVTRLISWGCAAALGASLKPGDLTLADSLIDADKVRFDIASDWHNHTKNILSAQTTVYTGCLAESSRIVSSSKDKKQLHVQTGAIALDMESIAVAKIARQHALPFLAIRAIVDPVNMNLPKAIDHSLNDQGDVVIGKLLIFLTLHPFELPGLIKLGLHFNAAKNKLKLVAKQLDIINGFGY